MSRCIICVTGTTSVVGCYEVCSNCDTKRFIVNDLYLETSVTLVGILHSNLTFKSDEDYNQSVAESISTHLPLLRTAIMTYSDVDALIESIAARVKETAVNLTIGDEVLNEIVDKKLVCLCGCETFNTITVGKLLCASCDTIYVFDTDRNTYKPYFQCEECGSIEVTEPDATGLCYCGQGHAHIYLNNIDTFRRIPT